MNVAGEIKTGDRVAFTCPTWGKVNGRIREIIFDISNGQRVARICPDDANDRFLVNEPIINLKKIA